MASALPSSKSSLTGSAGKSNSCLTRAKAASLLYAFLNKNSSHSFFIAVVKPISRQKQQSMKKIASLLLFSFFLGIHLSMAQDYPAAEQQWHSRHNLMKTGRATGYSAKH